MENRSPATHVKIVLPYNHQILLHLVQSAFCTHRICIKEFNQPQTEDIAKNFFPESSKSKTWICHGLSTISVQFSSVAQSCLTLRPHESQHARPPCPSQTPGVYSSSCPLSRWCHPAIASSVVPFSCPQLPHPQHHGLFPWGGQSTGISASVLPMNTQDLSLSGWTGCISLQSKGLFKYLHSIYIISSMLSNLEIISSIQEDTCRSYAHIMTFYIRELHPWISVSTGVLVPIPCWCWETIL